MIGEFFLPQQGFLWEIGFIVWEVVVVDHPLHLGMKQSRLLSSGADDKTCFPLIPVPGCFPLPLSFLAIMLFRYLFLILFLVLPDVWFCFWVCVPSVLVSLCDFHLFDVHKFVAFFSRALNYIGSFLAGGCHCVCFPF